MKRSISVLLFALACAPIPMPARVHAGPVTFQFTGMVTRVSDPLNLLDGGVEVGSRLVGSYTFESTTLDSEPDLTLGLYNDAVVAISGMLGGVPIDGPIVDRDNRIRIDNGMHQFTIDAYTLSAGITLAGQLLDFGFYISDLQGIALSTDALPLSAPPIELFEGTRVFGIADTLEVIPIVIEGEITGIVPEPATLVLVLIGAGYLSIARYKRLGSRLPRANQVGFVVVMFASVLTFGVARAEDCNTNGINDADEVAQCKVDVVFLMDTSTSMGLGDIRPWPNDNDVCEASDVNLARDEFILLYQPVPATGTRTVAVDRNNNVWVGGTGGPRLHGRLQSLSRLTSRSALDRL